MGKAWVGTGEACRVVQAEEGAILRNFFFLLLNPRGQRHGIKF